jgi:serine O-acetyltransferase
MTYPLFNIDEARSIFCEMLFRDAPLPGLQTLLSVHRDAFDLAYSRLITEHGFFKSRYYRIKKGHGFVNPLYMEHYLRIAYWFSREIFLAGGDRSLCDAIFLSIKSRGAIDLYYEFDLNSYFYPAHAFGSVLGRATYSPYLVISQNCTIGNNKGIYPVLGSALILRPGAMVLGNCKIGNNVQIAAGAIVIDRDVPDDTIVFGRPPNLIFKPNPEQNIFAHFDAP